MACSSCWACGGASAGDRRCRACARRAPAGALAVILQHGRRRPSAAAGATSCASVTDCRKSRRCASLRLAHSSCVMQRRSSWQFSRPPHCVASIGSSTATMMSATETVVRRPREVVAAAGAAHALDQARAAQLAEQLLEVGQRDLLPVRHARQRDRALGAVHRHVDHRRDGETSFGGQAHGRSPFRLARARAGAGQRPSGRRTSSRDITLP